MISHQVTDQERIPGAYSTTCSCGFVARSPFSLFAAEHGWIAHLPHWRTQMPEDDWRYWNPMKESA